MTDVAPTSFHLDQASVDVPLLIAGTSPDAGVAHRLSTLGWRQGAQVRVVKRAAGGANILDLNGSRVAIGRGLARTLTVGAWV
jgi:Fe2+ transport system protein FeoA